MQVRKLLGTLVVIVFLIAAFGRETAAREVKVAVCDFQVNARENLGYVQSGLAALLPPRITVPGRISVIDAHKLKQELSGKTGPEALALAKRLGADYAVIGSITKLGDTISVDAVLIDLLDRVEKTRLFAQSPGFDALIPEITKLSEKIKKVILEGALLEDHVPPQAAAVPEPAHDAGPEASAQFKPAAAAPAEQRPKVAEAPLEDAGFKKAARAEPPEPEPEPEPVTFQKPQPLFVSAPALSVQLKGQPLHALASGDVNGDGRPELLLAGEDKIMVYAVEAADLKLLEEIRVRLNHHVVAIDTADFNDNNRAEIYISSYEGHFANSFVLEKADNGFKNMSEDFKLFFRVYQPADKQKLLLAQDIESTRFFSTAFERYDWKDGKLIPRGDFSIGGVSNIYGFAEADLDGSGAMKYVVFTKGMFGTQYELTVVSKTGRAMWRDQQGLGGSPNLFSRYLFTDETERQETVPLRVICEDLDNEGRAEVIVGRNSKKGKGLINKLTDFNQGEVLCLFWDGSDLVSNWTSGVLGKFVSDYIFADVDGDGQKELCVLSRQDEGMFKETVNAISIFRQAGI